MPGLRLHQQNHDGRPEDLPAHLDSIETGDMSYCVSVIVAWNPLVRRGAARFSFMRGFHGAGGLRAVNFTRLFRGVANNARTMVWMISGFTEGGEMEGSGGVRANRGLILRRVHLHLPGVIGIACIHGVLNATVNRYGICSTTPA